MNNWRLERVEAEKVGFYFFFKLVSQQIWDLVFTSNFCFLSSSVPTPPFNNPLSFNVSTEKRLKQVAKSR